LSCSTPRFTSTGTKNSLFCSI